MWNLVFLSIIRGGDDRLDHFFHHCFAELFVANRFAVLRRDHHRIHALRPPTHIFHGHLRLAVGPQEIHLALASRLRKPPRQPVRQLDRHGHQLFGLVAGIAEHQALIARAAGVNAHGDVRRLVVDRGNNGAGLGVEAILSAGIPNVANHFPGQVAKVDVGVRGDFARYQHQSGSNQGLARHAAARIVLQHRIENGIGNLVGDFIGMALGNRLRGKKMRLQRGCQNVAPPVKLLAPKDWRNLRKYSTELAKIQR